MTSFRTQFTSPMYVFCKVCRRHVKTKDYAKHANENHAVIRCQLPRSR